MYILVICMALPGITPGPTYLPKFVSHAYEQTQNYASHTLLIYIN